jgi:hypothetical protein
MTKSLEHQLMKPDMQLYRHADHRVSASAAPPPHRNLAFPFNVYAHARMLQEGESAGFHHAPFPDGTRFSPVTQREFADLILTKLPPPPGQILEIGSSGSDAALSWLSQRGYTVQSITAATRAMAYVQDASSADNLVTNHELETYRAEPESFMAILLKDSAQTIEPLAIFNKAQDLLAPSGHLLLMDEFLLKNDATLRNPANLHYLDHMITLAGRFGFELIEHTDLSALAAPAVDYRLQIIATHRQRLIKDLSLSHEQLAQLEQSNRVFRDLYRNQQAGYALLLFRKKTQPKWRLQLLKKNQLPALFDLFRKTFNHDMTPAVWHWKYNTLPGREIGVWREHQLIAHYGGIARKILFFGQPQTAVQIGDVMVDSSERGTLTKKGPFFLMAATFLERYIGYNKPYLLGFGFPNERAMKVAERYGLYAEVGRMVEFSWDPLPKWPRIKSRLYAIDRTGDDYAAAAAGHCWRKMAQDLSGSLVGIRDWSYLQHRYLNHPSNHYQIVLVKSRFGGKARGIIVLRHDSNGCEVVDLVAALREIPELILHARRLAGINGHQRLYCKITENFAAHFTATGGIQQALDFRIPASIWDCAPAIELLRDRWWLMSGDMDFR